MKLFIAEKPSVASAIAEAIGIKSRKKGYIECQNDITVTNCFGHMLELAPPEHYMNKETAAKFWKDQPLPIIPVQWSKLKKKGVGEQLKIIQALLKKANTVVNAGDPDREGQNLVDEILAIFKWKGETLRYWQSAMDATSVKRALAKISPNSHFIGWGKAAESRSRADWIIGMNMTRCCTIHQPQGTLIHVGRVQTPVLKLVVDRDLKIENFKSQDYYNIIGAIQTAKGSFNAKLFLDEKYLNKDGLLTDKSIANQLGHGIQNKTGEISAINILNKVEKAKLMFTQTTLASECSRLYKFTAKKTLEISQRLYEEHKLTSYPRSGCEYLPTSQKGDVSQILSNLKDAFPEYAQIIKECDPKRETKLWNDEQVAKAAHTGIVPTLQKITAAKLAELKDEDRKVYSLIVKRYIAAFLPDHTYNEMKIGVLLDGQYLLTASAKTIKDQGWKIIYSKDPVGEQDSNKQDPTEDQVLPPLTKGMPCNCSKVYLKPSKTKPPARFTEGSLMMAMKNIAKEIDDPEEKKLLKETDGLGTEATRAEVIDKLKAHGTLELIKGKLISTQFGRDVLNAIPKTLQSASLTAKKERDLQMIQDGTLDMSTFLNNEIKELKLYMAEANKNTAIVDNPKKHDRNKCPKCGSLNFWRDAFKNKDGYYWHCKDCKAYFEDVNCKPGKESTPAEKCECPKCKGVAFRNQSKDGKRWYWRCKDCKTLFEDNEHKLGNEIVRKEIPEEQKCTCPKCGKTAVRYEKDGKAHWWCRNCDTSFWDKDGKIGAEKVKQYSAD